MTGTVIHIDGGAKAAGGWYRDDRDRWTNMPVIKGSSGKPVPPVIDQEHPMLPDSALYGGRGFVIAYEPGPAETALLGYRPPRRWEVSAAYRF